MWGQRWYLGSRLKLADISAVNEAIGLRRSPFALDSLKSKYPDPVVEAEVELVKFDLAEDDEVNEVLNARAKGPLWSGFGRCGGFCCEMSHSGDWSSMGDSTKGPCLPFSCARGEASMLNGSECYRKDGRDGGVSKSDGEEGDRMMRNRRRDTAYWSKCEK